MAWLLCRAGVGPPRARSGIGVLEAQALGIAPIALSPVTAAVVAEVPEGPEQRFRSWELKRGGQRLEASGSAVAEQGLQPGLQGQHLGGGLLADALDVGGTVGDVGDDSILG